MRASLPALYREQLDKIPVGTAHATGYQRHVKAILELLFKRELNYAIKTRR